MEKDKVIRRIMNNVRDKGDFSDETLRDFETYLSPLFDTIKAIPYEKDRSVKRQHYFYDAPLYDAKLFTLLVTVSQVEMFSALDDLAQYACEGLFQQTQLVITDVEGLKQITRDALAKGELDESIEADIHTLLKLMAEEGSVAE